MAKKPPPTFGLEEAVARKMQQTNRKAGNAVRKVGTHAAPPIGPGEKAFPGAKSWGRYTTGKAGDAVRDVGRKAGRSTRQNRGPF